MQKLYIKAVEEGNVDDLNRMGQDRTGRCTSYEIIISHILVHNTSRTSRIFLRASSTKWRGKKQSLAPLAKETCKIK